MDFTFNLCKWELKDNNKQGVSLKLLLLLNQWNFNVLWDLYYTRNILIQTILWQNWPRADAVKNIHTPCFDIISVHSPLSQSKGCSGRETEEIKGILLWKWNQRFQINTYRNSDLMTLSLKMIIALWRCRKVQY